MLSTLKDEATPIIVLAAGASTRLGQSKQQLLFRGVPLLEHTVTQAHATGHPVCVVLGSNAAQHKALIKSKDITTLVDSDWKLGMGHTLKFGLQHLLNSHPNLKAIIISVCDQPFITAQIFQLLIAAKAPVAACKYNHGWGVPALFTKPYFNELLALTDSEGAKKVLLKHEASAIKISFPAGDIDIDTPDDLANL
jgi:molybdenum cofactor cytidylyltransferase